MDLSALFSLLQFTDSAFPVGTFSFSNGLETAAHLGLVYNAPTLEEYVQSVVRQAAYTDGVAALHAHRAALNGDYEALCLVDNCLLQCKMNEENRMMLCRMGRKLTELAQSLYNHPFLQQWIDDIKGEQVPGTYPVGQGLLFALAGVPEKVLFCSHQYGVANMVLGAALRCVRVSHYDTQLILHKLGKQVAEYYRQASCMTLEDMYTFVPQMDIIASLHEKGSMRMFMN